MQSASCMLLQVLCLLEALFLSAESFDLTLLHTNDVHARFEGSNAFGGSCTEPGCYGGASRRAALLKSIRSSVDNVLLLDGGDQFQGTFWFNVHMGNATAAVMQELRYDAMALGNHEFDIGLDSLEEFLIKVTATFPVLSSNIDTGREPRMSSVLPYTVVTRGTPPVKIGIIGYTTKTTPTLVLPENTKTLTFGDEVNSVRESMEALKQANPNIGIFIAVGHAGFNTDRAIAAIDGIDVVIGGHTNTFLYTGPAPSNEVAKGLYPTTVQQPGGGQGLVVQDFAFGKYLGNLTLTFDAAGVVTSFSGNPILLGPEYPQDAQMETLLQPFLAQVEALRNVQVGSTLVKLQGSRDVCRQRECNLGSVITDAMVHFAVGLPHSSNEWTRAAMAIQNGGGIRSSIEKGNITQSEISLVQPFRGTMGITELKGSTLMKVFEHSVSGLGVESEGLPGSFLQVSGIYVTYDLTEEPGSRVVELLLRCRACEIPEYAPVEDSSTYSVVLPDFVAQGGDGFAVIPEEQVASENLGTLDSDVTSDYIRSIPSLYRGEENRVRFTKSPDSLTCSGTKMALHKSSISVIVCLHVLFFSAFQYLH